MDVTNSNLELREFWDNQALIPNGSDWGTKEVPKGFFLYVPASVTVHFLTYGGQDLSIALPIGVHKVRVKKVFGDNVSVVYAVW